LLASLADLSGLGCSQHQKILVFQQNQYSTQSMKMC
jgi:hypothetical protein